MLGNCNIGCIQDTGASKMVARGFIIHVFGLEFSITVSGYSISLILIVSLAHKKSIGISFKRFDSLHSSLNI